MLGHNTDIRECCAPYPAAGDSQENEAVEHIRLVHELNESVASDMPPFREQAREGQPLKQYAHLYRLYATLSKVSMAILHADSPAEVFQSFCQAAVKHGFRQAWVAWPSPEGDFELLAAEGPFTEGGWPSPFLSTKAESSYGNGPTGKAFRTGQMQIASHMDTDPAFKPWHALLEKTAIKSIAAMPLSINGQPFACFALYAEEPDFFAGEKEQELVTIIGRELNQALAWHQTRQDIHAMQDKINWFQQHDLLTGLPSRQIMLRHLRELQQRNEGRVTVALLAIDQFSELNGRHGYAAGDAVLCFLGKLLQEKVGPYGHVGRMGGNCFAVVTAQPGWVLPMLESIHKRIAAPFLIHGKTLHLSASIGVADAVSMLDAEEVLCQANRALDRASMRGGNQWYRYEDKLDKSVLEKERICNAVRHSLRNNEFMAYFQPKLCLLSNAVMGAEALVRWRRDGDILPPGEFLPAIADTELMLALDWYMLKAVAEILSSSRSFAEGAGTVSVNLSQQTLAAADFVPRLQALLRRYSLHPDQLELEVLETVVLLHETHAISNLERCRALGFHIALDDFGTGASSLVHLQMIPADTIKMDRRFIQKIHDQQESMAIVAGMAAFAKLANKKLCAEGIETEAMKSTLTELGCTLGQGYLIARPMNAADFEKWLVQGKQ